MKAVTKKAVLLLITVLLAAIYSGCTKKTSGDVGTTEEKPEGKIAVTVVDKATKKPVADAKISIVGLEDVYNTDEKGLSPEITLEVNKDIYKKYGESLYKKAPSGTATILITKDGYKDYIVFNKAVYAGYTANTLKVELTKPSKNDKQKYDVVIDQPHEIWVQDLIEYCKTIKDDNEGTGENKLTVAVKDQSSKSVEGALVIIPELNLRAKTDKTGKCILKPELLQDAANIYPVQRDVLEYTVVLMKDGYYSKVVFNASVDTGKDSNLNLTIKQAKGTGEGEFNVDYRDFEGGWVEKVISSLKE